MKQKIQAFAGCALTVSLCITSALAQLSTVKRDNGIVGTHYLGKGHVMWEESVILQPKGPCEVQQLYVYFYGTAPYTDTVYLAGDPSEGFLPPTEYVRDHNLLTAPLIIHFSGKSGWDTVDLTGKGVRSDGYDRIVVQHQLKDGGPSFAMNRGGGGTPATSFLYNPYTPNPNFYQIPGIYYTANASFMVRLGVTYDVPAGDSSQPPPAPTLVDVTKAVGLTVGGKVMQSNRVSVADWNGDGWDDIAIGSTFFQNNGDGTFKDVSAKMNIAASATVWGDFDNDGKIDCYAINGGTNDKLYKNNGDGTFTDVTTSSKLSNPYPTITPIWFDYNHDGYLDLYISNGRTADAQGHETYFPDQLWKNNGDGTFTNETDAAGISAAEPAPYLDCWGAAPCDYNGDGWPDIFVANYRLAPDFLFSNNRDGTFTDVGAQTGVQGVPTADPNYFGHGIGCDWGDFNNDGLVDLAVGNLGHPDERGQFSNPSLIFQNGGGPNFQFQDMHQTMGLKFKEMNSGIMWLDLNNDGYLDLWHCQYSYQEAGTNGEPYRMSRMYINAGPKSNFHLNDETWQLGSLIHGAWTSSRADFFHDGRQDIIVASGYKDGVKLFRNELPNVGNWAEFKLSGSVSDKVPMDAYGTSITAFVNGMKIYRELMGGGSGATGTQYTNTYHFGLGAATMIDSIRIRYPNGAFRVMKNIAANKLYVIPYAANLVGVLDREEPGFAVRNACYSNRMFQFQIVMGKSERPVRIDIEDILGRAVGSRTVLNAGSGLQRIAPFSPVPTGTYLLRATSEEGTVIQKISVGD